jgi:hypothetical protein
MGRGQCDTGFGYSSGNCTTGWIAYKSCSNGPWAKNTGCSTGDTPNNTANRQCCLGSTPAISNLKCTSGAMAGGSCVMGTNYSQFDCS